MRKNAVAVVGAAETTELGVIPEHVADPVARRMRRSTPSPMPD
jgi:hypothetical protein